MNFLKILNTLAVIAVLNVDANENNASSGTISSISLSDISVANNNKNNSSMIANASSSLNLSNSSIDVSLDIEQDYFDCEESVIERNDNSDSEDEVLNELVDGMNSQ